MKKRKRLTELGLVPEEWTVNSLGEKFKLRSGEGLSKVSIKEGKHAVYGGNGISFYHSDYTYEKETIIIGRVGAYCGCIHRTKPFSWITDNALILAEKLDDYDDNFMFFVLNKLNLNDYANKNAQPVISGQKIYPLKVGFPPLPEQRKIADIVSTVDEKIEAIDQRIAHTQELKKGLMQRLLTKGIGHTRFKDSPLGKIPESWEVGQLEKVVQANRQITYGIVQPGKYDSEGVFLVRGKDYSKGWANPSEFFRVSSKVEEPYKRARLHENDLITTIVGAGVGNMAIVPKWLNGANITQTTARIAIDFKYSYKFYFQVLSSHIGKKNVRIFQKGGAQAGLNLADINKYLVPIPPLHEQQKIADILTTVDNKLDVLKEKKQEYQQLKKGLMQQLLTGKIRVPID